MKRKMQIVLILAIFLVATLAFCACDSSTADNGVAFDEDMSHSDIIDALYVKTLSATFTPTNDGIKAFEALDSVSDIFKSQILCEQVKLAENGFSTSTHTVIYESGRLYQFVNIDGNSDYSVQEVSIEQIKAGEIVQKNGSFYSVDTISFYLFGLDKNTRVDAVNNLRDNWTLSVENNAIVASTNVFGLETNPLFVLSNLNSTELDIPEQYKDYKSFELTK